jgi:hypothetical protein
MLLIAGHHIVRAGGIGTFQELIIIGVARDFETTGRSNGTAMVLDELQQLLTQASPNPKSWPGQHIPVFLEDGSGYIKTRRFGNREH